MTYYKSKKMLKLLAAVNLPQVGEIKVIEPDPENDDTRDGGLFTIQLNSRDYTLKAEDHQEALEWVSVLKKLKDIDKKEENDSSDVNAARESEERPQFEKRPNGRRGMCGMCGGAS